MTASECRRTELIQMKAVLRSLFPAVEISDNDESVRIDLSLTVTVCLCCANLLLFCKFFIAVAWEQEIHAACVKSLSVLTAIFQVNLG